MNIKERVLIYLTIIYDHDFASQNLTAVAELKRVDSDRLPAIRDAEVRWMRRGEEASSSHVPVAGLELSAPSLLYLTGRSIKGKGG